MRVERGLGRGIGVVLEFGDVRLTLLCDLLVDSGTHGDPKPGEVSKHVKPFDRKQILLESPPACHWAWRMATADMALALGDDATMI